MSQLVNSSDPVRDYLVTSHSIDGTFESCPRRFEFRHVIGMVPDTEDSGFAADAGTAIHEAVQEWARTQNVEKGLMALLRWWPWAAEDAREYKDARNFGNAILLYHAILDHPFWQDWEVANLPDNSLAIELAFRINHTSLGHFRHPRTGRKTYLATQGKMDFIVRHRVTGRLMVVDLKTTTLPEETHEAAFRFSGQAGQYGMVLSTAVGHDFRLHGLDVCYLVAEFGTLGPNVEPFEYHLSPDEVEDSIRTKQDRLSRMISMAREEFWPRRTHGCHFFKQPCGYLDVCHRRDYEFLIPWFSGEDQRFKMKERIYEPYWTLEA